MFERYPRIRFQFAHLGGTAPFLAHRLASLADREPERATQAPAGAIEYLRRQYARVETDPLEFDQHPPEEAPGGEPVISRAGEGERFDRGDRVVTIRFALPQLCLVELAFEPPFEVAPHVHDDHVDSFYVVDGEVEFTQGDEIVTRRPGDFFAAPPGTRHGFRPANDSRARVLNVHAPDAGFADSLRTR